MLQRALAARDLLAKAGIAAGIVHFHTVKPLDIDTLISCLDGVRLLVSLEEHVGTGGFGSALLEALTDQFIQSGYSIRSVIRQWVSSNAYQLSSRYPAGFLRRERHRERIHDLA